VIWIMTILLYVMLYYELLKKAVHGVELWQKYGRKLRT